MVSKISSSSVHSPTQLEPANDSKVRHSLNARSTISSDSYSCFDCLTAPFRFLFNVIATVLSWVERKICGEDLEEQNEDWRKDRFGESLDREFFDNIRFENNKDNNSFKNNKKDDWKANAEENNWRFEELSDDDEEANQSASKKTYHVEEPEDNFASKTTNISPKKDERFFVKEIDDLIKSLIQPGIFLRVGDSCDAVAVLRINQKTHILYQEKEMKGQSFTTFCGRTLNWLESQSDHPLDTSTELMLKVVLVEKIEENVKFSVFTEYRNAKNQQKLEPTYETINSSKARNHNMTLFSMDNTGKTAANVANFFGFK